MIDVRALERLKETVGNDPADLIEIIESFLEEAPALLQQMSKGVEAGDLGTVQRGAHSLKSNARDFGAVTMADLCQGVEEDLRSGQGLDDASGRVSAIAEEWAKAESALRSVISQLQSA